MAIKTHKVTLSLDNPRVIQSGINVQSFDKQSIQISIELTKNDEVFQVPSDATIRVSLLKLARQEQKIIVDVPNTNRDSIDWVVPDYLDGYQGVVRVGVYLVSGEENVDLGYFTILSNVSDIDKMADEFTDNVFQGWEQIEADLNELNLTIAQTKLDLADDLTQVDNTIANINAKNTQVNTLASDFTADVATKQADVTSKYNAFDTDITEANQTIDDILALQPQFQSVIDETTGKDVISAPEIILARNGEVDLKARLDKEQQQVTAQLAQTKGDLEYKINEDVQGLENNINAELNNVVKHRPIHVGTSEPSNELGENGDLYLQTYGENEPQLSYEEKLWTPEIKFAGNNQGIAYGLQSGKATKIGNRVFCDIDIRLTNKGTSSGRVEIHGLPYTQAGIVGRFVFGEVRFIDFPTDAKQIFGLVVGDVIIVKFIQSGKLDIDAQNSHLLTGTGTVRLSATFNYSI